ncbi:MAG: glutaminyl-peptide cyclotransferase [Sphingobacteriales bacterium]|nr:MAG: glutaminyl-peptide cyclotransferase [Sphingobacteriales bacterium]
MKRFFALSILALGISCNNNSESSDPSITPPVSGIPAPATIAFSIISEFPHDTSAYTQGLELYKGKMYESTGDWENSTLRITDHKTGKVEQKHSMGTKEIFGEGITILRDTLYQLTWESNVVYVYGVNNINKPIKTFKWPYDGWGITNNGTDLIISDGSSNIYFVNPADFTIKNTLAVQSNKGPIDNINELEYVGGVIYANIYQTNAIIKIDPESGHVKGILNFPANFEATEKANNPGRADVLNGIAYDSTNKSFYLTGKRWSKMFEVKMN